MARLNRFPMSYGFCLRHLAILITLAVGVGCAPRLSVPPPERQVESTDELSSETDFAAYHMELGNEYFRRGMYQDALDAYKRSLQINPYSAEAQNNLGQAYFRMGRKNLAASRFRRALRLDPSYTPARNNLAAATEDPEVRIQLLQQALKDAPKTSTIRNNMCYTFVQMGKLEEGVVECLAAVEIDSADADAHYNLGSAYQEQGRLGAAVDAYLKALKLTPRSVDTLNNLGLVYYHQTKKQQAREMLIRALSINPRHPIAHYNLGLVLEAIADYTGAADSFELYLRYRRGAIDSGDVSRRVQELRIRAREAGS